jgi:eukaryotic-like serine/threonine-protein kinase
VPPLVTGFIITGEIGTDATSSQWAAVRSKDGHPFVLKVIPVPDLAQALELATEQMAVYDRIRNEHLVRRHSAIATADGRLALVLEQVNGGTLAQLLAARGQLTPGETVTTVAPLFRALADLHAAGVVHGDLAPGNVLFSTDGKPLIGDLGLARLLGGDDGSLKGAVGGAGIGGAGLGGAGLGGAGLGGAGLGGAGLGGAGTGGSGTGGIGVGGFAAPELAGGAEPSPLSDVYAMAALGWFCLTGAAPAPPAVRRSLTSLRPDTPLRLVEVLTSCLATNPAARPSAGTAAVEIFEAASAESVALASVSDPAAEITRRIRAAAASVADPAPPGIRKRHQAVVVCGAVGLLIVALGGGTTWFLWHRPENFKPAVRSATQSSQQPATLPTTAPARQSPHPQATLPGTMRRASGMTVASQKASQSPADMLTAPNSPRTAAAGLVQALADARALAYVARNAALLDLVYAPGATKADVDKGNIATALKNGGTYLGLSFVIRDVAFLDGTSDTARIRATIFTPAYMTGQPDGRKIPHAQEILGPCIFTLSLTSDGWRIRALTTP